MMPSTRGKATAGLRGEKDLQAQTAYPCLEPGSL
jgi:hypothetical protein